MMGERTKKCIDYDLKSKKCRVCAYWKRKNTPARKHCCTKNFSGSAKSMEPALAVTMAKRINAKGKNVSITNAYTCILMKIET